MGRELTKQEADTKQTVSIDDGRCVSFTEYGAADGRPVVFLHGTPGSRFLGQILVPNARQHDVRVLAIDRPGYGQSSPWPTRTLANTGDFVAPVMEAADVSRSRVIGFSGGGPHALAFATTHGKLVTEVDVISGTVPPSLQSAQPKVQQILGILARRTPRLLKGLVRVQAAIAKHAPPEFVTAQYTTGKTNEELPEEMAQLLKQDFLEAVSNSRSGVLTESRLFTQEWDISLDRVTQDIRFWHGEQDTIVPIDAVQIVTDQLPNNQLVTFSDADHLTTLLHSRSRLIKQTN